MPKRIIVCCDGTWQASDSGTEGYPSNVAKLSRMIAPVGKTANGDPIDQVVFYQAGVASGNVGWFEKRVQGAFGDGLDAHVIECYHFIATNWYPGDEICLFGFSRGAYTARAIGWTLTQMGMLKPVDLEHFPWLYRYFKEHHDTIVFGPDSESDELKEWTKSKLNNQGKPLRTLKTAPAKVNIEVVGVWDTVGSLGLPESIWTKMFNLNKGLQFYNTALNSNIKHAFQALALDEHRGAFTPTLWYLEPEFKGKVDLRQCWFPGYHCDIGGGWYTSAAENQRNIDNYSLAWMCDQIDGLVSFDLEAAGLTIQKVEPTAAWSGFMTADPITAFYSTDIGGGSHHRTPGSYHHGQLNEEDPDPEKDNSTIERMHPSVQLRIEAKEYNYYPKSLDERKSLFGIRKPKWTFVDRSTIGDGARWVRDKVEPQKRLFASAPLENRIEIKEHIIKEIPGKNNFEASLLPKEVKERLMHRNRKELENPTRNY